MTKAEFIPRCGSKCTSTKGEAGFLLRFEYQSDRGIQQDDLSVLRVLSCNLSSSKPKRRLCEDRKNSFSYFDSSVSLIRHPAAWNLIGVQNKYQSSFIYINGVFRSTSVYKFRLSYCFLSVSDVCSHHSLRLSKSGPWVLDTGAQQIACICGGIISLVMRRK